MGLSTLLIKEHWRPRLPLFTEAHTSAWRCVPPVHETGLPTSFNEICYRLKQKEQKEMVVPLHCSADRNPKKRPAHWCKKVYCTLNVFCCCSFKERGARFTLMMLSPVSSNFISSCKTSYFITKTFISVWRVSAFLRGGHETCVDTCPDARLCVVYLVLIASLSTVVIQCLFGVAGNLRTLLTFACGPIPCTLPQLKSEGVDVAKVLERGLPLTQRQQKAFYS